MTPTDPKSISGKAKIPAGKRAGRRLVRDVVTEKIMALNPSELVAAMMNGEDLTDHALTLPNGQDGKAAALIEHVKKRLEEVDNLAKDALEDSASLGFDIENVLAKNRADSAVGRIQFLETATAASNGLVASLTQHLLEQIIVDERIKTRLHAERNKVLIELVKSESFLGDFAIKMRQFGISARDIQRMGKDKIIAIAALILNVDEKVLAALDTAPSDDPIVEQFVAELEQQVRQVEVVSAPLDRVQERDNKPPTVVDPNTQEGYFAPMTRWGKLDVEKLGYRIEEITATTQPERAALTMRMPQPGRLEDQDLGRHVSMLLEELKEDVKFDKIITLFSAIKDKIKGEFLNKYECRAWLLLGVELHGWHITPAVRKGYYNGALIPKEEEEGKLYRLMAINADDISNGIDHEFM